MSPDLATSAKELLASLASPEDTRAEAKRLEVVRRQGVVDAYSLLATVVLGLVVRGKTTIAAVGRLYGRVTRRPIARSAFWNRLTPEFALLVKWLLDRMVAQAAQTLVRPPGVLSCFQSVFAADSTVVKVHDDLRPIWKGFIRFGNSSAMESPRRHKYSICTYLSSPVTSRR